MFLHLSVILFTGGVHLPWADPPPPGRYTPRHLPLEQTPPLDRHSPWADTPPRQTPPPPPPSRADTPARWPLQRTERILLECILVRDSIAKVVPGIFCIGISRYQIFPLITQIYVVLKWASYKVKIRKEMQTLKKLLGGVNF